MTTNSGANANNNRKFNNIIKIYKKLNIRSRN